MASPRHRPAPPDRAPAPPPSATLPPTPVQGEPIPIIVKKDVAPPPEHADAKHRPEESSYVRNSSFLSRDLEARKNSPPQVTSPPKKSPSPPKAQTSPRNNEISPPNKEASPPKEKVYPPKKLPSPPKKEQSPPKKNTSPPAESSHPKKEPAPPRKESLPVVSPPKREVATPATPVPKPIDVKSENSVAALASRIEAASPPKKQVTSPPFKINRNNSKTEENSSNGKIIKREDSVGQKVPPKAEKLTLVGGESAEKNKTSNDEQPDTKKDNEDGKSKNEESNGVGDKIKKFERAAEDASGNTGKLSRTNSVRGRARTDRVGSDSEFPPPATPFRDGAHFDLPPPERADPPPPERQYSFSKNPLPPIPKWSRGDSHEEKIQKPEPLKIIKPLPAGADVPCGPIGVRPGGPVQLPSQGTAFRNVASPDTARAPPHKFNDDVNTQNNFKQCKAKPKKEYSISKGSSYFTRGSEEIWLVKKKDIEEIEERVFDSFRRAGGNVCVRSESVRPSSDGGQGSAFAHATMGRSKRAYGRSESLDPAGAGARAHTLRRQTSVACTCGHDKKPRPNTAAELRPRSRSHGDDNHSHVLDKYETLV